MKHIALKILFLCLLASSAVKAQIPIPPLPSEKAITRQFYRAKFLLNMTIPVYVDTTAANTNIGLDSLGALIQVRSTGVVWHRDTVTGGGHKWAAMASGTTSTAWGTLTGTLSSQTDLQNALNGKQNLINTGTIAQYFRGDLSLATFPTSLSAFSNDPGYISTVRDSNSITGNGVAAALHLVNDVSNPGIRMYYGTDTTIGSTKGWYKLPAAGGGGSGSGSVTSIATASPITGGTITATGTIGADTTASHVYGLVTQAQLTASKLTQLRGQGTAGKVPYWATSTSLTDGKMTMDTTNLALQLDNTYLFGAKNPARNEQMYLGDNGIVMSRINTGIGSAFTGTMQFDPTTATLHLAGAGPVNSGNIYVGPDSVTVQASGSTNPIWRISATNISTYNIPQSSTFSAGDKFKMKRGNNEVEVPFDTTSTIATPSYVRSLFVKDTTLTASVGTGATYSNTILVNSQIISLFLNGGRIPLTVVSGQTYATFTPSTGTFTLTNGTFTSGDNVVIQYLIGNAYSVGGGGGGGGSSGVGSGTVFAGSSSNVTATTASDYYDLADLSGQANRTITMPAASINHIYTIKNNNSAPASGFTWSFAGRVIHDFHNNSIVLVPDQAVIQLRDDGIYLNMLNP